jgi:hypothetical protein
MNKRLLSILAILGAACIFIGMAGFILAINLMAGRFAYCEHPLSHCETHPPPTTNFETLLGLVPWLLPFGCVLLLFALASWGVASIRQNSRRAAEN